MGVYVWKLRGETTRESPKGGEEMEGKEKKPGGGTDLGGVEDGVLQCCHVVVLLGVHARVREHHRSHPVHRKSVLVVVVVVASKHEREKRVAGEERNVVFVFCTHSIDIGVLPLCSVQRERERNECGTTKDVCCRGEVRHVLLTSAKDFHLSFRPHHRLPFFLHFFFLVLIH